MEKMLGIAKRKAYEMANFDTMVTRQNIKSIMRGAPNKRDSLVVVPSHQNPNGTTDKAQFDIIVTRQTGLIAQPLQVAIFGDIHKQSAYGAGIVSPATGGTLVVSGGFGSAIPDRIRFAHTVGVNTDNVDITCNQVPYPTFLQATGNDVFRISNIRYILSNPADTNQYTQLFSFKTKTLFGKAAENAVSVNAYKKPEQFQAGVIDIPVNADIDKETLILLNIANGLTAYPATIQISVFVERFTRIDRHILD